MQILTVKHFFSASAGTQDVVKVKIMEVFALAIPWDGISGLKNFLELEKGSEVASHGKNFSSGLFSLDSSLDGLICMGY